MFTSGGVVYPADGCAKVDVRNKKWRENAIRQQEMDAPGGSLFLGGPSIYIDDTAQRLQEQEEEEEQQQRKVELHEELNERMKELDDDEEDSVFDEFDDDYNHSINNSSRFANTNIQKSHKRASPGNLRDELSNEILGTSPEDLPFGNYAPQNDSSPVNEVNQHYNHYGSLLGGYEEYVNKKTSNEFVSDEQQLKMLYEVRVKEVQRLSEELKKYRQEASKTHDALYARLAIANSEKERAQISLQQSQELVVNSKHHIMELERKVSSLSNKVETLENQNEELATEVSSATASLMDTQTRLQAEKFKNGNVQTDAMFRSLQDRYKEDTERLEQDLAKTRSRLVEKENELLVFEKRFIDMERFKENLLVEKGSIINKLAVELEEAHNRIPNNDLMEKISRLTMERNSGKYQIKELANKLESTANELVETRSKLSSTMKEKAIMEETINEMLSERQSDSFSVLRNSGNGKEFSSHTDNVNLLRNEFSKTLKILQLRKEEIEKLKKSLKTKEEEMEVYLINEKMLNEELESHKETNKKLLSELKILTDTSQAVKNQMDNSLVESLRSRCEDLENQIIIKTSEIKAVENCDPCENVEKLSQELYDAKAQLKEYQDLYFEVCGTRDKLLKELEELKSNDLCKSLEEERLNCQELLEQLKNEKLKVDDLGNQLLNIKIDKFRNDLDSLKKNSAESSEINCEIDELKKNNEQLLEENLKLKISEGDMKNNFSKLINELEESRELINQLNNEIEILGQRDQLISDLKEKGKQLGEFIEKTNKMVEIKSAATSPRPFEVFESSSSININLEIERSAIRKEIRKENSEIFNMELKTIENGFNKKFYEAEKQFNAKIIQLGNLLKMKTEEVESLKEVVLSERQKFQEASDLQSRESLHNECKSQLLLYQKSAQELLAEVEKLKSANKFDSELQAKFLETLQTLEKLKDKYKIVKKTALKYKKYIVERDEHYKSEIARVENVYKESLSELNQRLDSYIKQKEEKSKLPSSNSQQAKGKSIKKNEPPND